jgi:hypothetical protein
MGYSLFMCEMCNQKDTSVNFEKNDEGEYINDRCRKEKCTKMTKDEKYERIKELFPKKGIYLLKLFVVLIEKPPKIT